MNPSTKYCILCNSEGKVGNFDNTECIFFNLETTDHGICDQVVSEILQTQEIIYHCIKCHKDYLPMFDINITNQYNY